MLRHYYPGLPVASLDNHGKFNGSPPCSVWLNMLVTSRRVGVIENLMFVMCYALEQSLEKRSIIQFSNFLLMMCDTWTPWHITGLSLETPFNFFFIRVGSQWKAIDSQQSCSKRITARTCTSNISAYLQNLCWQHPVGHWWCTPWASLQWTW